MKKRFIGIVLSLIICLITFTGCSKKGDVLSIYSRDHSEEYREAAKKHFRTVGWSNGNYLDDDLDNPKQIGNISIEPPRYVVVISDDKAIINSEPIPGKRYSIFVYDNSRDDITISIIYKVGTTDDCVVKGNVTSGEFTYNDTLYIRSSGITDPVERAALIFDTLIEELIDIEG